jgi:hypothetical protein
MIKTKTANSNKSSKPHRASKPRHHGHLQEKEEQIAMRANRGEKPKPACLPRPKNSKQKICLDLLGRLALGCRAYF